MNLPDRFSRVRRLYLSDEVRVATQSVNVLTPRERQILEALVQGNTTREIADSCGIGRQTVKNYVTVIYEKLGVRGRRQLLQFANSASTFRSNSQQVA